MHRSILGLTSWGLTLLILSAVAAQALQKVLSTDQLTGIQFV